MKIENKEQSLELINELGLNKLCETIFRKGEEEQVKKFLEENPAEYYVIRNKDTASGKYYVDISKEEVLQHIGEFEEFSIDISIRNYQEHKMLIGDISIKSSGEVMLWASRNKESTHRNMLEPQYSFNTTIADERLKYIMGLNRVINYVYEHELIDVIVEFCLFDIPVGNKKENMVVLELRTEY